VKREGFAGMMIWALDMDDASGKFCRKKRKKPLVRFPLISAMKDEFEKEDLTTVSTTPIQTTTLSNGSSLLNGEFQDLLDEMFDETSSSTKTLLVQSYFHFIFLPFVLFHQILIN